MSQSNPLVSVIIPMFNSEKYIYQTVQSALEQTWKKIEFIIIDDGSTDAGREVLKSFSTYPDLTIVDQENRGASAARNTGIRYAKGDYIQFLDADDVLHPEKISRQVNALAAHDTKTLVAGAWLGFQDNIANAVFIDEGLNRDYDNPIELLLDIWSGKGMLQPGVWLVSRELIQEAGLWNEELSTNDDGEYFNRVVLKSSKIISCPESQIYYRKGNIHSLSNQQSYKSASSVLRSFQAYCTNTLPVIDNPNIRLHLARNFSRFMYEFYGRFSDLITKAEQEIKALQVNKIPAEGGKNFKKFARAVGFKNALRIKSLLMRRSGAK